MPNSKSLPLISIYGLPNKNNYIIQFQNRIFLFFKLDLLFTRLSKNLIYNTRRYFKIKKRRAHAQKKSDQEESNKEKGRQEKSD
jgi:hypothetical protein